jgi:hypothetical protein
MKRLVVSLWAFSFDLIPTTVTLGSRQHTAHRDSSHHAQSWPAAASPLSLLRRTRFSVTMLMTLWGRLQNIESVQLTQLNVTQYQRGFRMRHKVGLGSTFLDSTPLFGRVVDSTYHPSTKSSTRLAHEYRVVDSTYHPSTKSSTRLTTRVPSRRLDLPPKYQVVDSTHRASRVDD